MNMSMWRKYFHVQVVHVFHIGLLRDPILEILQSVSTVPLTILYDQLCQGGKNLSNLYLYIYTCVLLWSIRHPYLLLCTCSMRAGGMVWWSCRTRWHPEESRTPQTWRCRTLPACSSRWMLPGQRCKQSSPWWETLLQRIYPKGKNKKILII